MKNYFTLLFTVYCFLLSNSLTAQSSCPKPDSSFNGVGYKFLQDCAVFEPNAIIMQPDCKILSAGFGNRYDVNGGIDGILTRTNPDGSTDTGFGTNGIVTMDIDAGAEKVKGISMLPDNKILVLLESSSGTFLVRLNSNGAFDNTFGNDGFIYVPTENFEFANGLLVQNDQKILILSEQSLAAKSIVTVRRCKPNGALDENFGTGGRVTVGMLGQSFYSPKGVLQIDGKLVFTGGYGYQSASGFIAVRLNLNGSFDNSFGNGGIFIKGFGNNLLNSVAESIVASPGGTIYLGGVSPGAPDPNLTVLSLTPNGAMNTTFGTAGVARISFGTFASARSLTFEPDGKIIAAGYRYIDPAKTAFVLARFNANGSADTGFGDHGKLSLTPFSQDFNLEMFNDAKMSSSGTLTCLGWLRGTLDYSDHSAEKPVLLRFVTNNTVKTEEPDAVFQEFKAYPTLLAGTSELQLEYTLAEAGSISINLYDEQGRWIKSLISNSGKDAGKQNDVCELPQSLPSGLYYLALDNGMQLKHVKMFKQ